MEKAKKSGIYYGYVVMLACAVSNSLLSTIGMQATQFANGLMAADPNVTMSATALGLGYTFFALMQGIPGLFLGKYTMRKGPKAVFMLGSIAAVIIGILSASVIDKSSVFYVLCYGLGYGFIGFCSSQLAAQTLVNNWFLKKRGLGSAVRVVAGAILGIFAPYIIRFVTSGGNWRYGWYVIAAAGVVSAIVVALFMKDKPEDVGETIDGGEQTDEKTRARTYISTVYKRQVGDFTPFKEAVRSYRFWAFAIMSMGGFCVSNLLYSPGSIYFLNEAGMTSGHLANAQMLQMITSLVGAMLINRLADRIEPMRLVAACITVMVLGAFGATRANAGAPIYMYFFYIAAAIGMIGTMQVFAIGLGNLFGIEEFPRLQGLALCIGAVVSSQVSTIAGAVYDSIGSYIPAFFGFAIWGLICVIPSLFVRIPKMNS